MYILCYVYMPTYIDYGLDNVANRKCLNIVHFYVFNRMI